ncbi:disease resistance protein L6-like [Rhodamnia argentea]|uniref:Disease resistance protein L6-like n=1 Tax=Rhodamnia argentea TaxID=178133 RepID=A0ABM3HAE0_9MYRT|nr:disease resistance protein L6-like [Rhodamnia argentea]
MEYSEPGSSSDAAQASRSEYGVFLSFRGPDTRNGFTDFLYHGLLDAGVRVFRDEEERRVGEVFDDGLLRAIDKSLLYIPIFSQNYASSTLCLHELAHIVENVSKSEGKKRILPIFYDVEPHDVRLRTSLYGDAFRYHEERFPDQVEAWRKALNAVGNLNGWSCKSHGSQATLVKLVVDTVLREPETKQKKLPRHLVGLDDRIEDLMELIGFDHPDVRLIVIYGMGGIGKTTIAKVVFNQLSFSYGKCCSFLEDVRESSSTKEHIVQIAKKLLSDIVGFGFAEKVENSEQGVRRIGETLRTKRVLVVPDDVAEKQHIENLIGDYSLHPGSRIIITTRDKTILQYEGFNGVILGYEMPKMDDALALLLLRWHAFDRDFPPNDYKKLSSEIVSTTGQLPLAIEATGSVIRGKDKAYWEKKLVRLMNVPEKETLNKLLISYDGLDENEKQIFLDIACFFFNEKKIDAIYMWDSCRLDPIIAIKGLTEKCLIKELDNGKFWMHEQLIALGRQIVHRESPRDLGKQSRLWIA